MAIYRKESDLTLNRRNVIKGAVGCAGVLLSTDLLADFQRQKAIFASSENPSHDADVIVSAMILGYASKRLKGGKDCRFDVEPEADPKKLNALKDVVDRINELIEPSSFTFEKVVAGESPAYGKNKEKLNVDLNVGASGLIIGASGSLSSRDLARYRAVLPSLESVAGQLYSMTQPVSQPDGNPKWKELGIYQGRGAYTGIVIGREAPDQSSQPPVQLFPTLRHIVPDDSSFGKRWHPSESKVGEVAIGSAEKERVWGMILTNGDQNTKFEGMPFDGEPVAKKDIMAYTHGMIRAIYDVEYYKRAVPGKNPGIPHEIAFGPETLKLSSCFPCSVFMEATGYPASSTHLGRGESWSPLFPKASNPKSSRTPTNELTTAQCISEVNDVWFSYCQAAIKEGSDLLVKAKNNKRISPQHLKSVDGLQKFVEQNWKNTPQARAICASLFLDALTVHSGDSDRIDRVLIKKK